jgi:hypothetical protein
MRPYLPKVTSGIENKEEYFKQKVEFLLEERRYHLIKEKLVKLYLLHIFFTIVYLN